MSLLSRAMPQPGVESGYDSVGQNGTVAWEMRDEATGRLSEEGRGSTVRASTAKGDGPTARTETGREQEWMCWTEVVEQMARMESDLRLRGLLNIATITPRSPLPAQQQLDQSALPAAPAAFVPSRATAPRAFQHAHVANVAAEQAARATTSQLTTSPLLDEAPKPPAPPKKLCLPPELTGSLEGIESRLAEGLADGALNPLGAGPPPASTGGKVAPLIVFIWWDSETEDWVIVVVTIPYVVAWAQMVVEERLGLVAGQYRLELGIAVGSANTMHSALPLHDRLEYRFSFRRLLEEVLPEADHIFTIGERGIGYNAYGLYHDFLPRIKLGTKITCLRGGATVIPRVIDPNVLRDRIAERLVEDGVLPDPQTGKKRAAPSLLELAAKYSTGEAAAKGAGEAQSDEDAVLAAAMSGYIGRGLISIGKRISLVDGAAQRMPNGLRHAGKSDAKVSKQLGELDTVDDASVVAADEAVVDEMDETDGDYAPATSTTQKIRKTRAPIVGFRPARSHSKSADLLAAAFDVPIEGSKTCTVVGCRSLWTHAMYRLCDRHDQERREPNATKIPAAHGRVEAGPGPSTSASREKHRAGKEKQELMDAVVEEPEDEGADRTGGTFSCSQCPTHFVKRSSLVEHVKRLHSTPTDYVCRLDPACKKVYSRSDTRAAHEKSQHPEQWQLARTCEEEDCNRSFKTVHELRSHENFHKHNDPPASRTCFECQMLFSNSQGRETHNEKKHGQTDGTIPQDSRGRKRKTVSAPSSSNAPKKRRTTIEVFDDDDDDLKSGSLARDTSKKRAPETSPSGPATKRRPFSSSAASASVGTPSASKTATTRDAATGKPSNSAVKIKTLGTKP